MATINTKIKTCETILFDNIERCWQFKIERRRGIRSREDFMRDTVKEDIKRKIESEMLVCDCGEVVYNTGSGAIEGQPNYNKHFEYLECLQCRKLYYL